MNRSRLWLGNSSRERTPRRAAGGRRRRPRNPLARRLPAQAERTAAGEARDCVRPAGGRGGLGYRLSSTLRNASFLRILPSANSKMSQPRMSLPVPSGAFS